MNISKTPWGKQLLEVRIDIEKLQHIIFLKKNNDDIFTADIMVISHLKLSIILN
jgi:hypothetical protein